MLSIHKSCMPSSCLSTPVRHRGRQHPGRQHPSVGAAAAGTQAASSVCLFSSASAYHIPPVVIDAWLGKLITFSRSRRASHSLLFCVHLRKVYGGSVCLVDVCSAVRITTFGSKKYTWKRGIELNIQLGNMQPGRKKKLTFLSSLKRKCNRECGWQ